MLNNLKETMATEDALATLPTPTLDAEEKCCDAFEIKSITTLIEATTETITAVTKTPTSSPTKGKSIFNWFKSTTTSKSKEDFNDCNLTLGDSTATTATIATPTNSPERVHQASDAALVSSYCEFRGVQTLRHLWNKRISAIEAANTGNSGGAFHSAKVKKLHKSVSCLVSATISSNEAHCDDNIAVTKDAFDTRQTAHVKRRQARTKRAQSLVDCTLIKAFEEKKSIDKPTSNEIEISPLHREKDNFYKYKTAEQVSKLCQQQSLGVSKRLSAGIVSGNDSSTQKFPAIKTSDKGELIHWLRRDEIEMNTRRSGTAKKSQASGELSTAAPAIDVISQVQTMQPHNSETQTSAKSPNRASIAAISECRTSASKALTLRHSSADTPSFFTTSTGTRVRRNASSTRKYSFKTHARSYHSPRKMHASKSDKGVASGSTAQGFSMVAQLTEQFNALVQKDKTLLEEVKRNNGVLMSRGGHVYKVLPKNDFHISPGVSRASSRAKDYAGKASHVRRAIRNFERDLRATAEKPRVPAKSPHLLRKREEMVTLRNRQLVAIKRPKSGQKLHASDKVEVQLKSVQPRLEIVKEEAKTPLQGDKRSNDEVSTQNVSSFNQNQSTNVSSTLSAFSDVSNNDNNKQNVDITINSVNQAETLKEDADKNRVAENGDDVQNEAVNKTNEETVHEEVVTASNTVYSADDIAAANKAEQRLEPEGQEGDASNLEQLVLHTETVAAQADVASTEIPTVDTTGVRATDTMVTVKTTEIISSGTIGFDDDEEKHKQRKNKYAKIYEKFRFRKPLRNGQNKKLTATRSIEEINQSFETSQEAAGETVKIVEIVEAPKNDIADAKILDALDVIDQKLKGLSEETDAMVLCASGDFEQRVLPNSSFIYQALAKQVSANVPTVTQAVNVTLVNTIEGEQILKEEQLVTDAARRQQIKLIDISGLSGRVGEQTVSQKLDSKSADDTYRQEKITVNTAQTSLVEDMYEPIATANESKSDDPSPPQTFLFKHLQVNTVKDHPRSTDSITEDIYQTLEEVNALRLKSNETSTAKPLPTTDDYESIRGSAENGLAPLMTSKKTTDFYDGYESFEPRDENEPSPITMPTTVLLSPPTATLVRHTTDELPAIPEPKRKTSKSPLVGQKLRPAPPKPNTPPVLNATLPSPLSTYVLHNQHSTQHLIDDTDDQHYYADDENIYDIIKSSHCYESVQTGSTQKPSQRGSPKSLDTFSLGSNCYESITHYRRVLTTSTIGGAVGCMPLLLHSAGSTSTLSSDHKTNSLYSATTSLISFGADATGTAAVVDGGRRCSRSGSVNSSTGVTLTVDVQSNNYSHSNKASSEGNSDDWVDITDNEADNATDATVSAENNAVAIKEQFIVVRERSKVHRSPDWSKRVRDKRLQQNTALSCEDDSDHYYESLSPMNNKRHPTQMVQRSGSRLRRNQDLPRYALRASQRRKTQAGKTNSQGQNVSDDYDSFDTDTDEVYEADENHKNQNDSGVDTRLVKLPDPPSSKNQVYAMVKKLKNFISSKRSPSSKFFGSQQRFYENSSQFYIEGNLYQDSPKTKSNSALAASNGQGSRKMPHLNLDNDYENTEFHNPPTLSTPDGTTTKQLSVSTKNLSLEENRVLPEPITPTTKTVATPSRSESKSDKSFKSRLRNGLVGSSFDTKQLSTLMPARSKFYIEDPSHSGSGELDSGFSEKASTGDLTVDATSTKLAPGNNSSTTPSAESQKFSTATRMAKKEAKAANSQRRRTIIGIRPLEPPPPPPPQSTANDETYLRSKHSNSSTNTSWYAECGVFKNGTSLHAEHTLLHGGFNASVGKRGSQGQLGSASLNGGSHTSWYAEAGLYQTSDISVASSSGSSGVSTGNEACLNDDVPHSMFLNEPLYQIYSAAKLQSLSHDLEDQGSSSDGYEEIGKHGGDGDVPRTEEPQRHSRPTALQIVGPKNGPSRTLWCEIPEVIQSYILHTLTPRERGLQEAKFEIITSEASYLKSLNLLRSHFMNHPVFRDTNVVSARDRKALFSHIVPVHECSERLLTALESCWQDNIMLIGLSERIYSIAEKYFHVYIAFCENQGRMDRTLRRLKAARGTFAQNLELLEASPNCCGLNMQSFLMMPMQRITRLPLLIDAVFSKSSPNDDEYNQWKMTLAIMNKIVTECNDAANRCEQAFEIERIARQLEFPSTIRALAIAPVGVAATGAKPRFLVKKGELTHLIWRGDDAKLTFGKKFVKSTIFAFLFSDLLVLTKRKGEQQFLVFDYCPRNMLTISSGDLLPQLPTKDINQTGKNLILMTLLENHERKTVELVISCPSVSEQERWLAAMRPPEAETPGEKLYEQWDCPQVVTTHAYETNEPDALNLEVGDVINVTRKLPDGWYQGERIRDGAIGWFPGNHTEEVNSAHVRARNLKQRYRLLTFTASYLETQKRK